MHSSYMNTGGDKCCSYSNLQEYYNVNHMKLIHRCDIRTQTNLRFVAEELYVVYIS